MVGWERFFSHRPFNRGPTDLARFGTLATDLGFPKELVVVKISVSQVAVSGNSHGLGNKSGEGWTTD